MGWIAEIMLRDEARRQVGEILERCAHACRLQGVGWSAGEVQVQVKDRCTLAHWPHWSLGAHWVH